MKKPHSLRDRRHFLQVAAASGAFFTTPGLFAEELIATPEMTEGPFYPDKMPLDTDNDLLIINDAITPAVGEITHLSGRVCEARGKPIRNAFVEIWQVDSTASYVHTQGRNPKGNDKNFQGYGRFLTDARGQYYFRTIKPVPYTQFGIFRAPHIHFAVSKNGRRVFTTQMLINGHKDNLRDGLYRAIRDPLARETILVDFKPVQGSKIGELSARFDIVLGRTVEEHEEEKIEGGIGKPQMRGFGGFEGR
jgi:protocatechuate 3,4-dioxygenase beta subunit